MSEENDGVIVESSATEPEVEVTETPEAVTEEGSATSTEEASVAEPAVTEEVDSAPTRKKDAEARIRQLVEKERKTAEEAAYWKGVAEAKKEPVKAPESSDEVQPKADQFESYDDYVDARAAWRARQEYKALKAEDERKAKERETQSREEQVETAFKSKVQEFKSKTPDFEEVMTNPDLRISTTMYEALRESEAGAQIAYHLGKNPGEAARIAALSPIAAIREIGKLEAKFDKPPAQVTNTITKAPAPPATVDGQSGGATKDPSKMTDDEWFAWDKAERLKKFQARK